MKCQKFTGVRNLVQQGVYKGQRIRKELGISLNAKVILSVGEVNKNKNHKVGIEALAKLRDKNTYYVICGHGPLMEAHKELAQSMGVGDRVILTGYRTDVADFYKRAEVFLFPSLREGLPVAVMEAMAAGLPCIASRIRGNVDLLEKSRYLFEPADESALCQLLKDAASGVQTVQECAQNREMLKKYDIANVSEYMKWVYMEVLIGEKEWRKKSLRVKNC